MSGAARANIEHSRLNGSRGQGLTLVHFSAQHKHILWDTLVA
jgi:hypothetical protein